MVVEFMNKNYFISILSFYSMTKPADFTECVGDELPVGWEQAYDYQRGIYYVDHINSKRIFLYILGNSKKQKFWSNCTFLKFLESPFLRKLVSNV